jgi:signal transduction histidine kinase
MFTRRTLHLPIKSLKSANARIAPSDPISDDEYRVLVINGSGEMAKEISLQLTLGIPGCSIMYAPSIQLARLILARRVVNLIVSSTVLPDGGLVKLKAMLESLPSQSASRSADIVLVGEAPPELLSDFGASSSGVSVVQQASSTNHPAKDALTTLQGHVLVRRSQPKRETVENAKKSTMNLRALSADIRNDLNNPLQEIVAMAFIARSTQHIDGTTAHKALEAIDIAAKNMASIVRSLEDKIVEAVS